MGRPFRLHSAAAFALAVSGLAAQSDVTRAGKTFVVTLHPGKLGEEIAGRLADEALAAAERARPVLEKLYQTPAKPPTIHVWASPEEHRAVAQEPGWSFVRDAVCRPAKAESHVLLRPLLTERVFAEVGLPESTRDAVIVQAAMLAACDRSSVARSDPWCAEIFAAGVLEAAVFADARDGVDPGRDGRFWYLSREASQGKARQLRSLWSLVEPSPTPEQHDYVLQGNAAIGRLLASTGGGWAKKLLNGKVKESDAVALRRATALQAVLGADDKKNEERFTKLLATSAPRFRVAEPVAALRGGRILLAGSKLTWAAIGSGVLPPAGPYALRATIDIPASGPNPGAATLSVNLDVTETSALQFLCKSGQITVALQERNGAKAEEQSFPAPIEIGKPFALSLEVGDTIRVLVDGQQVADLPLGGRTMRGDWQLSRLDGTAWLENLRCEPLAPAKKK